MTTDQKRLLLWKSCDYCILLNINTISIFLRIPPSPVVSMDDALSDTDYNGIKQIHVIDFISELSLAGLLIQMENAWHQTPIITDQDRLFRSIYKAEIIGYLS